MMTSWNEKSGATLIEILVYVAIIGLLVNLSARVFMSGSRLSARATTAVERLEKQESFRKAFTEAVRQGSAIVEGAGAYKTGDAFVVLAAPTGDGASAQPCYIVLGDIRQVHGIQKMVLCDRDGELELEELIPFPGTLDSAAFSFDATGTTVQRAVTLSVRFEAGEGARRQRPLHQFTASLRGVGS